MTGRRSKKRDRSIALMALLSLIVALNMSQAVVLCIGGDGHIAIELAGHHHGEHDAQDHDHDVDALEADVSFCAEHGHCRPCTDIPLSTGPCEDRIAPKAASAKALSWICPLSVLDRQAGDSTRLTATSPLIEAAYPIPLRSIVLQV
jgi:hypothetical protein